MLKVLLVDDEPFILQGLSVMIDWEQEGFEIAGLAHNAFEALEVIEREKVDLLIADIRMPKMSGLELLEELRRRGKQEPYFAILSGYSDFEYAKRALQNECLDYILKPVRKDELLALLSRVRKLHEITLQRNLENSRKEQEYFARNMIPILYGKYDSTNLEYVKNLLGDGKGARYVGLDLDMNVSRIKHASEEERRNLQQELYRKCKLLLKGHEYNCIYDVSSKEECYDVGIIFTEALLEDTGLSEQEYLEWLQREVRGSLDFPIVFLTGSRVGALENLVESYRMLSVARSFRSFGSGGTKEMTALDLEGTEKRIDKQKLDMLVHAVEQNDKSGIEKGINHIFLLARQEESDLYMVNIMVNYLLFQLLHLALQLDENVNQEEILKCISINAFEHGNISDGAENMTRILCDYADYLVQLRGNQAKGVLALVEAELREHYSENLTLKDFSKKYFVNSAYLGQLFRKQYGESFKDYLNRVRIERAVELLLHTDKKIYEIAEETGYKDLDYFINKFIALKGCTPAKFRKQIRQCDNV